MAEQYTTLDWNGEEIRDKVELATVRGMLEVMSDCVQMAKGLVPVNYTTLQGSLELRAPQKIGNKLVGVWGSFNVNYALWVEIGTGPHMPPVAPLKDWARRKLGDESLGWPVALKIKERGTREQPYLEPSAQAQYPKLKAKIRKHL